MLSANALFIGEKNGKEIGIMLFTVQKNALKINYSKLNNYKIILIVTENQNIKHKNNTKQKLRSNRLKRLENQLKTNILKRKKVKKNNG